MNRRKDGIAYSELLSLSAIRDADGRITNLVGAANDITAFKQYEQQLDYLAHHDAMTGLPNRQITESMLMDNAAYTGNLLFDLRRLGLTVAIDDFGTGYSSLTCLKHFRVDALKIDKAFVAGLPYEPDDLALTSTVVNIAQGLHIGVIAEGVESEAQKRCLVELGCDLGQGYLFNGPLPAAEMEGLLTTYVSS